MPLISRHVPFFFWRFAKSKRVILRDNFTILFYFIFFGEVGGVACRGHVVIKLSSHKKWILYSSSCRERKPVHQSQNQTQAFVGGRNLNTYTYVVATKLKTMSNEAFLESWLDK
jgi:hypothetical protein